MANVQILPGKYNDIRAERVVAFAPTGVCDTKQLQDLGMDPGDGIDVLVSDD